MALGKSALKVFTSKERKTLWSSTKLSLELLLLYWSVTELARYHQSTYFWEYRNCVHSSVTLFIFIIIMLGYSGSCVVVCYRPFGQTDILKLISQFQYFQLHFVSIYYALGLVMPTCILYMYLVSRPKIAGVKHKWLQKHIKYCHTILLIALGCHF